MLNVYGSLPTNFSSGLQTHIFVDNNSILQLLRPYCQISAKNLGGICTCCKSVCFALIQYYMLSKAKVM